MSVFSVLFKQLRNDIENGAEVRIPQIRNVLLTAGYNGELERYDRRLKFEHEADVKHVNDRQAVLLKLVEERLATAVLLENVCLERLRRRHSRWHNACERVLNNGVIQLEELNSSMTSYDPTLLQVQTAYNQLDADFKWKRFVMMLSHSLPEYTFKWRDISAACDNPKDVSVLARRLHELVPENDDRTVQILRICAVCLPHKNRSAADNGLWTMAEADLDILSSNNLFRAIPINKSYQKFAEVPAMLSAFLSLDESDDCQLLKTRLKRNMQTSVRIPGFPLTLPLDRNVISWMSPPSYSFVDNHIYVMTDGGPDVTSDNRWFTSKHEVAFEGGSKVLRGWCNGDAGGKIFRHFRTAKILQLLESKGFERFPVSSTDRQQITSFYAGESVQYGGITDLYVLSAIDGFESIMYLSPITSDDYRELIAAYIVRHLELPTCLTCFPDSAVEIEQTGVLQHHYSVAQLSSSGCDIEEHLLIQFDLKRS